MKYVVSIKDGSGTRTIDFKEYIDSYFWNKENMKYILNYYCELNLSDEELEKKYESDAVEATIDEFKNSLRMKTYWKTLS